MPMIDVYAAAATYPELHRLATDLVRTLMTIEGVPDLPMLRQNTAGVVHELRGGDLSNLDGECGYVRVQVLANAGALDRDKQLAVVRELPDLVAAAPGDPPYRSGPGFSTPKRSRGLGSRPNQRRTGRSRADRDRQADA